MRHYITTKEQVIRIEYLYIVLLYITDLFRIFQLILLQCYWTHRGAPTDQVEVCKIVWFSPIWGLLFRHLSRAPTQVTRHTK